MNSSWKIKKLTEEQVWGLKKVMKQEQVAFHPDGSDYIGAYDGADLMGIVGWKCFGINTVRFKTDYVLTQYRGMGVYSFLWRERLELLKNIRYARITAYCTQYSLPKYLKEGFKILSVNKRGITIVSRDKE